MQFRTQINLEEQNPKIDYSSKIFLTGSCFVENMGRKLDYFKFQKLINPFGIMFHPLAIENFMKRVVSDYTYTEEDTFLQNERWHCFDAHSVLSNTNKEELMQQLNDNLKKTHNFLNDSTHVIITLGTAWVYRYLQQQKAVANCHKLPQSNFKKELLSVSQIQESLKNIASHFRILNPKISLIFTVSPVRHIKDGFVENQRSKAHIISALHEFVEDRENFFYFPSYELMMDELRDYRFYNQDMVHPSNMAIDYIWEKFTNTWFSAGTKPVLKEVANIQKGLAHKPFNESSQAHREFREKLQQKINRIKNKYPQISF